MHVLIDNGSAQSRKCLDLRSLQFSECKYSTILGLHAFTGNDYFLSFSRKGKERCWKLMQKYEELEVCFTKLGYKPNLLEDLFQSLEEYTAFWYGVKSKSINEARWSIFEKNMRGTTTTKSSIYPYYLLAKVFWGSIVKEQTQLLIFGKMLLILQLRFHYWLRMDGLQPAILTGLKKLFQQK